MTDKKDNYSYCGVAKGRIPGTYTTWSGLKEQVDRFSSECHAGHDTLKECIDFMTVIGQFKEDSMHVYGPHGGRYSLQDWIANMMKNAEMKTICLTCQGNMSIYLM
jgi:hypothetical protein